VPYLIVRKESENGSQQKGKEEQTVKKGQENDDSTAKATYQQVGQIKTASAISAH
jgi:hypothetical protein